MLGAGKSRILKRAPAGRSGLVLLWTVLLLLCGAAAFAQNKTKTVPAQTDLPGRVSHLLKQLYGTPLDESHPITSQIQDLVMSHIRQWLADRGTQDPPSDVEVRRELERVFAQVQYPLYAWPRVFARPWKGATLYGVGYTLGWSDYDRANVISLFKLGQGQLQPAATTHFVPHTDLHYEFMMPPPRGDFWFIAYGTRLGKSQRRLTAILYSFDGASLKSLWQVQDAYDGRISVGENWLRIRYLREEEYIRETAHRRKPPRYEALYKATPKGLELESTQPIPF